MDLKKYNYTEKKGTYSCELEVSNQLGLHFRPAALIVKAATKYDADMEFTLDGNTVSAKSVLGITTLSANRGAKLQIRTKGDGARKQLESIVELFEKKFFED